nr:MAG TPA_asm: tail fiber protein [Bacteriophage sp.]
MVTIEELKLGNRTLEALKFLLSQTTELETVISQININEIKDANTLTKEQIATLKDIKNAVEAISSDLNLKKSDFDEKKQNFDTNISAFKNDKADFDEKKADFDSKNNTALSNFAFISSNVEKINSTSALLTEAKAVLETIKPMEQRTQAALNTIANSQAKFAELEALKTTLLELKRSLESIITTRLVNDNTISETTTYSSKKVEDLVSNTKSTLIADIKSKTDALATIATSQGQSITTLDSKLTTTQSSLSSFATNTSSALSQKVDVTAHSAFATQVTNELSKKLNASEKGVANGLATLDNSGKVPSSQLPKIDAYTKQESDNTFALKTELQKAIPTGSYLLYSSNTNTPDGFLRCDGSALDKTTYAALFAVIGYTYGRSGDKFLLPNFSDGKFMRGTGGNATTLGTAQRDAIRNITGKFGGEPGASSASHPGGFSTLTGAFKGEESYPYGNRYAGEYGVSGKSRYVLFDASLIVPTANENRPYNMAVVVLIKY